MAAKKPYVAPVLRPISKEEAERIAGGPDGLETLGAPHVNPTGEPVSNVRLTIVSVEGDFDASTAGALGDLIGELLQ